MRGGVYVGWDSGLEVQNEMSFFRLIFQRMVLSMTYMYRRVIPLKSVRLQRENSQRSYTRLYSVIFRNTNPQRPQHLLTQYFTLGPKVSGRPRVYNKCRYYCIFHYLLGFPKTVVCLYKWCVVNTAGFIILGQSLIYLCKCFDKSPCNEIESKESKP